MPRRHLLDPDTLIELRNPTLLEVMALHQRIWSRGLWHNQYCILCKNGCWCCWSLVYDRINVWTKLVSAEHCGGVSERLPASTIFHLGPRLIVNRLGQENRLQCRSFILFIVCIHWMSISSHLIDLQEKDEADLRHVEWLSYRLRQCLLTYIEWHLSIATVNPDEEMGSLFAAMILISLFTFSQMIVYTLREMQFIILLFLRVNLWGQATAFSVLINQIKR